MGKFCGDYANDADGCEGCTCGEGDPDRCSVECVHCGCATDHSFTWPDYYVYEACPISCNRSEFCTGSSPPLPYDCNGAPGGSQTEDCADVCGGTAVLDQCGVCDGDGCSCTGEDPLWFSSRLYAGYCANYAFDP